MILLYQFIIFILSSNEELEETVTDGSSVLSQVLSSESATLQSKPCECDNDCSVEFGTVKGAKMKCIHEKPVGADDVIKYCAYELRLCPKGKFFLRAGSKEQEQTGYCYFIRKQTCRQDDFDDQAELWACLSLPEEDAKNVDQFKQFMDPRNGCFDRKGHNRLMCGLNDKSSFGVQHMRDLTVLGANGARVSNEEFSRTLCVKEYRKEFDKEYEIRCEISKNKVSEVSKNKVSEVHSTCTFRCTIAHAKKHKVQCIIDNLNTREHQQIISEAKEIKNILNFCVEGASIQQPQQTTGNQSTQNQGTGQEVLDFDPFGGPSDLQTNNGTSSDEQTQKSDQVICGQHTASKCSECPQGNGASWCNGDCEWINENCVLRASSQQDQGIGQVFSNPTEDENDPLNGLSQEDEQSKHLNQECTVSKEECTAGLECFQCLDNNNNCAGSFTCQFPPNSRDCQDNDDCTTSEICNLGICQLQSLRATDGDSINQDNELLPLRATDGLSSNFDNDNQATQPNTVLPPRYLSIKNYEPCLSSHQVFGNAHQEICIPIQRPQGCEKSAHEALLDLGELGHCDEELPLQETDGDSSNQDNDLFPLGQQCYPTRFANGGCDPKLRCVGRSGVSNLTKGGLPTGICKPMPQKPNVISYGNFQLGHRCNSEFRQHNGGCAFGLECKIILLYHNPVYFCVEKHDGTIGARCFHTAECRSNNYCNIQRKQCMNAARNGVTPQGQLVSGAQVLSNGQIDPQMSRGTHINPAPILAPVMNPTTYHAAGRPTTQPNTGWSQPSYRAPVMNPTTYHAAGLPTTQPNTGWNQPSYTAPVMNPTTYHAVGLPTTQPNTGWSQPSYTAPVMNPTTYHAVGLPTTQPNTGWSQPSYTAPVMNPTTYHAAGRPTTQPNTGYIHLSYRAPVMNPTTSRAAGLPTTQPNTGWSQPSYQEAVAPTSANLTSNVTMTFNTTRTRDITNTPLVTSAPQQTLAVPPGATLPQPSFATAQGTPITSDFAMSEYPQTSRATMSPPSFNFAPVLASPQLIPWYPTYPLPQNPQQLSHQTMDPTNQINFQPGLQAQVPRWVDNPSHEYYSNEEGFAWEQAEKEEELGY